MGVCIKLATRSLRKNKGRTLITLMGIVLSVLMVCTIFTLLNSMLDSAIDSIIEKDGYWHIAVYNTTAEQSRTCFFQAEDGIRDIGVTGVQTCALPI